MGYFRIGKAADFRGTVAAFKAAVPSEGRRFDEAEKMWRVDEVYGPVLAELFRNYPEVLRGGRWRDKRSMFGWRPYRMSDAVQELDVVQQSDKKLSPLLVLVFGLIGLILYMFGS